MAAIFVAAIYGLSFVAIRIAVEDLPPLLMTAYRYLLAALPWIVIFARPAMPLSMIIAYGVMQGAVMFGLVFTAISLGMPAGLTSLVVQTQIFFTLIFAFLFFGERPNRFQIAGLCIGAGGIALLGAAETTVPLIPFLMVIGSAAAWGLANMIAKRAKPPKGTELGFIAWSSLPGAIVLFALSSVIEGTIPFVFPVAPTWSVILSVLFLGLVTQLLAFALWVNLLSNHPASSVMPFALLIPVFGIGSTTLVFSEPFTPLIAAASIIVMCGLALSMVRRKVR